MERIKASQETGFYNGISSILGKSFQLASYNEYAGDPSFYMTDIQKMKAVTKEDIIRVYNKYIKGKPYLATSFVPKGQLDLVAEGSTDAAVKEEDINNATQVSIEEMEEEPIPQTPSSFDRKVIPIDGPDPAITLPVVWRRNWATACACSGLKTLNSRWYSSPSY